MYLLYTFCTHPFTAVYPKKYLKINHISCLYFSCIHQVYIRYNRVDFCTLFVNKLYTNHLHIFVRDPISGINKTVPSTLRLKVKVCSDFMKMVDISWHHNTTTTTTTTICCTRSKDKCYENSFALFYTEFIKIMYSAFTSIIFFLWLSPRLCVGFAAVMVKLFLRL